MQLLRGRDSTLKSSCQAKLSASREEYVERGHSLEEQDDPNYDKDNLKTHVFVQLADIQKQTIYPIAKAFLHGL
jgi:hypothetical protein